MCVCVCGGGGVVGGGVWVWGGVGAGAQRTRRFNQTSTPIHNDPPPNTPPPPLPPPLPHSILFFPTSGSLDMSGLRTGATVFVRYAMRCFFSDLATEAIKVRGKG